MDLVQVVGVDPIYCHFLLYSNFLVAVAVVAADMYHFGLEYYCYY